MLRIEVPVSYFLRPSDVVVVREEGEQTWEVRQYVEPGSIESDRDYVVVLRGKDLRASCEWCERRCLVPIVFQAGPPPGSRTRILAIAENGPEAVRSRATATRRNARREAMLRRQASAPWGVRYRRTWRNGTAYHFTAGPRDGDFFFGPATVTGIVQQDRERRNLWIADVRQGSKRAAAEKATGRTRAAAVEALCGRAVGSVSKEATS